MRRTTADAAAAPGHDEDLVVEHGGLEYRLIAHGSLSDPGFSVLHGCATDALARDDELHDAGRSIADLADAVVQRHAHVIEEHGTTSQRTAAHVVEARDFDARQAGRYQDRGDTARPVLRPSGPREQQIGIGGVRKGDGSLLAIEDEL